LGLLPINQSINRSLTRLNITRRPVQYKIKRKKLEVSKYLCTACVSENYNQTTESYAQTAARDAVVAGGIVSLRRGRCRLKQSM